MEVMDDLLMSEPRPGTQSSGNSGVGSGRSGSSAGQHPPHPSQQQRVSIGSSYYGAGSRYGDGTTSTVTSSARQSTSYSTQFDSIRVGAGVVVTSHRQSQRRLFCESRTNKYIHSRVNRIDLNSSFIDDLTGVVLLQLQRHLPWPRQDPVIRVTIPCRLAQHERGPEAF